MSTPVARFNINLLSQDAWLCAERIRKHPSEMLCWLPGASGNTGMERNQFAGKKNSTLLSEKRLSLLGQTCAFLASPLSTSVLCCMELRTEHSISPAEMSFVSTCLLCKWLPKGGSRAAFPNGAYEALSVIILYQVVMYNRFFLRCC